MSDLAITCCGLSKRYRVGERESYRALRDVITNTAAASVRRLRSIIPNGNGSQNGSAKGGDYFWALDDVSFEIKRGEVVAIIGRNGAGKSTLLKILSRITKPTNGSARIHGRVGSLLEVGTGFHPELTGRDNIFLNGAILGMRKREIERKFDEIVSFAEVETFIDTPVKRYSSGMYVRLAFAVAAHMETEILLVDEVLAVGDAAFQKKCIGKMGDVSRAGKTVLLVTHNLPMAQRLCSQGLLLNNGRLVFHGPSSICARRYGELLDENQTTKQISSSADGSLSIRNVRILDEQGIRIESLDFGHGLQIEIEVEVRRPLGHLAVDMSLYATGGNKLFGLQSDLFTGQKPLDPGLHKATFSIRNPTLSVPEMHLDVGLRTSMMGMAYDVLLSRAAVLACKANSLPTHALADNLVTPDVELSWQ